MTPLQIRKAIKTTDFSIDQSGIEVEYDFNGEPRKLIHGPNPSCEALEDAGIIDSWREGFYEPTVTVDGKEMLWRHYCEQIGMFQYAAILIVVNDELAKESKANARKTVSPLFEMFADITRNHAKNVYGINL